MPASSPFKHYSLQELEVIIAESGGSIKRAALKLNVRASQIRYGLLLKRNKVPRYVKSLKKEVEEEKKVEITKRNCLGCSKSFGTNSKYIRLCDTCKERGRKML